MGFVLPLIIVVVLASITLAVLNRNLPRDEGMWLGRIFVIGLILRLILATVFVVLPETRIFHEDAWGYEGWGMTIARGWAHEIPPIDTRGFGENRGYYLICASLYYVFGPELGLPSFLNTWIGMMTVVVLYRLARYLFHPIVARRATLFLVFFPSNILWSSIAVKDPLMVLLVVLTLYNVVRLHDRFEWRYLLGIVLPLAGTITVRFYIFYVLLFAIAASLTLFSGRIAASVGKQVALFVVGAVMIGAFGLGRQAQSAAQELNFKRASQLRYGLASTAQSGFYEGVDVSTPQRAIAFLPIGVVFLLLSPFPWQMTSLRAAMALPEMVIWWAMLAAWIRGLRFALQHDRQRMAPIFVFTVVLTMAYATVHGNVGVAFRQRTQITVFLYVLAALGHYLKRCQEVGLPFAVLLNRPDVAARGQPAPATPSVAQVT